MTEIRIIISSRKLLRGLTERAQCSVRWIKAFHSLIWVVVISVYTCKNPPNYLLNIYIQCSIVYKSYLKQVFVYVWYALLVSWKSQRVIHSPKNSLKILSTWLTDPPPLLSRLSQNRDEVLCVNLTTLGTSCKWNHAMFILLWLTYFT